MNEITQHGIEALKRGDRLGARDLLNQAVSENPENVLAWLWLSGAVDSDEQRIDCLLRVLQIDPENQAAVRGLEKLSSRALATVSNKSSIANEPTAETTVPEDNGGSPIDAQSNDSSSRIPDSSPEFSQDQPAPQVEPAQPQIPQAAVPSPVVIQARQAAPATPATSAAPQRIFRIRPSLVPALTSFWFFFILLVAIYNLLGEPSTTTFAIIAVLFLIFEFIVLYVIVRNFRTVYELTDQYLSLPIQGKKAKLFNSDVLHIEPIRTFWQKIRGTADLLIDGVIDGKLTHLRLRDITDYKRRMDQISSQAPNLD